MTCSTCNGSRRVPWPEAGMMQDCPTCKTSAQADVERVRANRQAAKAIDFGARYTTPEPMTGKGLDIWGRELGLTRNFLEDDGALRSRCREAVRQRQVFRNDLDSVRAITMPVLNAIERVLYQARADGLNVRFTRDGSLLTITIGPPA